MHSRNKISPRSAQILIVIGKAFAMHVNARSSNHDPNHVLDRDLKRLSERDSFSCEHSQFQSRFLLPHLFCPSQPDIFSCSPLKKFNLPRLRLTTLIIKSSPHNKGRIDDGVMPLCASVKDIVAYLVSSLLMKVQGIMACAFHFH